LNEKWEYRLTELYMDPDGSADAGLNRLGEEGWEAVSMFGRIEKVDKNETMPLAGWRYSERTILVVLLKRPA